MKLKEMSGGSNDGAKIITKTISTNGLATNFDMQQVALPEKHTFILNQKNEEISIFGSKQQPIDVVQNRIVFDNELKLVSSMRSETRADFISSVVALETHLKSFHKVKSDKFNFFAKDFETNVLEQKTVPVEQKTVSNLFSPKSILEASEALRVKSISSQHHMVKDELLKISQPSIANPLLFKAGNQLVNSANSSSTLGNHASSINDKIVLYDAQYKSRISMLVVDKVLKGRENFEIHLEPKSFGKIKINVLMDKQGLDIRMVTETQAAASLLRGSEDSLNQITNQNGMKLASFSVGMQSGSDQQRQNSNQTRNRAGGKANSMLEHTKTQNLQTATSGSTSTGLNLIA
jgi:flagellar hook-length control protein FliK